LQKALLSPSDENPYNMKAGCNSTCLSRLKLLSLQGDAKRFKTEFRQGFYIIFTLEER
jgi:hypothetical protein